MNVQGGSGMNTFAEQINSQVDAGRKTIERSLADMKALDVRQMPPAAYIAGAVMATAIIAGAAWMVLRSRRKRTLVERLQDTVPEKVRDLPGVRRVL
jgi:hypothetical protein